MGKVILIQANPAQFKGGENYQTQSMHEQRGAFVAADANKVYLPDENGFGSYTKYQGAPFLRKGVYDLTFTHYNNILKRITIGMVKALASKGTVLPLLVFACQPWKWKLSALEQALDGWRRMGESVMAPALWKDRRRYTPMVRELNTFVAYFLIRLGITQTVAESTAEIFGSMFEHDDVYRYRVEDLFSEVIPGALMRNPRREMIRVFNVYISREHATDIAKFGSMVKLLSMALLLPRVKKAFKEALAIIDIKKLSFDKADLYWAMQRDNYDWGGKDAAFWKKYAEDNNWTPPVLQMLK